MSRLAPRVLLLLATAALPGMAAAAGLMVDSEGDGLAVSVAEGTSLAEALTALGEAYGFTVTVRGDPGFLPAIRFRAASVADAVRRLARGNQLVIRHRQDASGEGTVSGITLLARRVEGPVRVTVSGEPAAADRAGTPQRLSRDVLDRLVEIAALGDRSPTEAIPELQDAVQNEAAAAVRAAAIRALAALRNDEAWPVVDIGLSDKDAAVRIAALRAQPAERNDFPFSLVEEMAQNDPDPEVRRLARSVAELHYER